CSGRRQLRSDARLLPLSLTFFLVRKFSHEMLDLGREGELPAAALDGQLALLAGRSSQHVPHLSHGRSAYRNVIDRNEVIAGLDAIGAQWERRFSVEVGDAQDGKSAVVFGTEHESDDIKVREIECAAKFEVDGGVG